MQSRRNPSRPLLLAAVLSLPLPSLAAVLHVKASPAGAADGSSWANAASLQAALAIAQPGDQLWVAEGVHKPASAGNPALSFMIPDGVAVYGGFAGTESSLAQRDWKAHATVLSGDIDGNDTVDAQGVTTTHVGANSQHVVRLDATGTGTLLDGVFVSGGDAGAGDGGGVLVEGGQAQLRQSRIVGNRAQRGGGIALHSGSLELSGVEIALNAALGDGGGLHCLEASVHASDSRFVENLAQGGDGGGMHAQLCPTLLTRTEVRGNHAGGIGAGWSGLLSALEASDCRFEENFAEGSGGAIRYFGNAEQSLHIRDSQFRRNLSTASGAGVFVQPAVDGVLANELGIAVAGSLKPVWGNGMVRIERSEFRGNRAQSYGGGLATGGNYLTHAINTLFSGNAAGAGGGAAFLPRQFGHGESLKLLNTTFSGNFATAPGMRGGGLLIDANGTAAIHNSVFWNNRDSTGTGTQPASIWSIHGQGEPPCLGCPPVETQPEDAIKIRYSMVQGCKPFGNWDLICGTDGGGNLADADPRFVAATVPNGVGTLAGDARLQHNSPVIDEGNNRLATPDALDTDLAGLPRIANGVVDMGAYEQAVCPPNRILHVTTRGAGNRDGSSWANAFGDLRSALSVRTSCHIWVAEGSYRPGTSLDRQTSFVLAGPLKVFGGFAGTETALSQRNWSAFPSVLTGEIGNAGTEDNALHVVRIDSAPATALLDGFWIEKGRANLATPTQDAYGAGVLMNSSAATLRNLVIRHNVADGFGGGLYKTGPGQPLFENISFESNSAGAKGGGMHTDNGNATLRRVAFTGNVASQDGGGLSAFSGDVSGSQLRFAGNTAGTNGGGLLHAALGKLTNVELSGNYAGARGGGVYTQGTLTLTNASIAGNRAGSAHGGVRQAAGSLLLQNSFVWNNREASTTGSSSASIGSAGGTTVRFSMLQGCKPGGAWNSACGSDGGWNLVDANPLLLAPLAPTLAPSVAGDHRLQATSPLRNKGDNAALPADVTTDLGGLPRIVGGLVDHGAHEVQ